MASIPQGSAQSHSSNNEGNNTIPLIIVTILFFMWGAITSLNDVLIPHLKSVFTLTYMQAALVQLWFFGAYFLVSLPAGMYVRSFGYKKGAVTGLVIAAIGCLLFYPAATSSYNFFLFAFFILAAGITVLQVAANPYVAVLGSPKTASSRLTLTQAFNSLGTTVAPKLLAGVILGGATFLGAEELAKLSPEELHAYHLTEASSVQMPYLMLAGVLLLLAVIFAFAKLPTIVDAHDENDKGIKQAILSNLEAVKAYPRLALGVLGIFLYVGAEVSIGTYLVNFLGLERVAGLPAAKAAEDYLYLYWGGAMVGRFIGFFVMRYIRPGIVLSVCAGSTITLIMIATFASGPAAMWSLIAVGLFNSIMFPTIFTMALHDIGKYTSQGSGLLCMGIVGGAIVPYAQGGLADTIGLQVSFLLPAACYLFIFYFGAKYANLTKSEEEVREAVPAA
ncbi:MFS transporter [Cellvibrio zantedeschiae]|uniref:MFS transporter n=1 Tax=Cellvibrio zantedeschiae TaxID=1237077 RepID=A0ABQ3AT73_9GAMM|nr:L-fucose:H+ symporter permease [Cellvibrio zantedeschiae]GGY66551.1 MFS transporter [Cellvibrio zantedeschiae]